jgi:hypothetical protein
MKNIKFILPIITMLLTLKVHAEDCQPGYAWDAKRNRCMYTQTSLDNQAEYISCEESDNKEACYEREAKARVDKTRNEYGDEVKGKDVGSVKSKGAMTTGLMTAFSAVSVVTAFFSKNVTGITDSSLAVKVFAGTSAAGFIKNTFFEKDVEKKTDELKDKFEKEVADTSSMKDGQIRAFDYLEEEQAYLEKHSKEQKKFYNMLALGYTGASIAAAYEIFVTFGGGCSKPAESGTSETQTKPEPSKDPVKTDTTNTTDAKPGGWEKFAQGLQNPCVILPAGIVMAGFSYKLGNEAGKNAKEAGENVTEIQKLKEKYVSSIANYCPDGREDLKKPYCYCYLQGGEKNPNRSKSQTCQTLWNSENMLYAKTSDLIRGGGNKYKTGCVFVDGKFDPSCNCKKLKNSGGQNACMKTNMPKSVLSSFGNLDTSSATNSINSILEGNASDAAISPVVNDKAAIAKTTRDALVKKINPLLKKELGGNVDQIGNKLISDMAKLTPNNSRVTIIKDAKNKLSANRPAMKGLEKAIRKAGGSKKSLAILRGGKSLRGSQKTTVNKKNKFFSFGSESSSSETIANFDVEDEVMKKKYKYNNDIVNDKDVSIFKVISNRYSQSGLKRLFSED